MILLSDNGIASSFKANDLVKLFDEICQYAWRYFECDDNEQEFEKKYNEAIKWMKVGIERQRLWMVPGHDVEELYKDE